MVFKRRDRRAVINIMRDLLWPKGGWSRAFQYVKHRVRRLPDTPERIARGIWVGVFTTFTPFSRAAGWGSKLIIMDEPTAALGIQETTRVENIIRGLKARSVPVIIISHNLRQVFNLVDRIVVFRQGRIAGVLDAKQASGNDVVAMITGVNQGVHDNASYI